MLPPDNYESEVSETMIEKCRDEKVKFYLRDVQKYRCKLHDILCWTKSPGKNPDLSDQVSKLQILGTDCLEAEQTEVQELEKYFQRHHIEISAKKILTWPDLVKYRANFPLLMEDPATEEMTDQQKIKTRINQISRIQKLIETDSSNEEEENNTKFTELMTHLKEFAVNYKQELEVLAMGSKKRNINAQASNLVTPPTPEKNKTRQPAAATGQILKLENLLEIPEKSNP